MLTINAFGKPCPIPVIEAKKALSKESVKSVLIKVDNFVAVQNLEKMANGLKYGFSYTENAANSFDVFIDKSSDVVVEVESVSVGILETSAEGSVPNYRDINNSPGIKEIHDVSACVNNGLAVLISSNKMGSGDDELGKILIKGFIYSLTELPAAPKYVIFLNSGAFLSSEGSNTIDDLKILAENGTEVLTCGTCANYYDIQDKLAVGEIVNMYDIVERLAGAGQILNI